MRRMSFGPRVRTQRQSMGGVQGTSPRASGRWSLAESLVMALVVLDKVHIDFPIYGPRRELRNTLFRRAVGGLISSEDYSRDRVVIKALNGFALHLEDGDRIGLVGYNGVGKFDAP